nr:MAG TPA: hypothetical protein [Caudoviricetes sp.]
MNLDRRARLFPKVKNFARSVRPSPTRQWLSLWESWHRR